MVKIRLMVKRINLKGEPSDITINIPITIGRKINKLTLEKKMINLKLTIEEI